MVSEAVWKSYQERLAEGRAVYGGNPARIYLLSGLLRCPSCGRGLFGHARKDSSALYRCTDDDGSHDSAGNACRSIGFKTDRTEAIITSGLKELPRRKDMVNRALAAFRLHRTEVAPKQDAGAIRRKLEALQAKERAAIQAQIAGIQAGADPSAYDQVIGEIVRACLALEARLSEAEAEAAEQPQIDEKDVGAVVEEVAQAVSEMLDEATHSREARHLAAFH